METLKLKKGSWHYRLASITANLEIFNEPDICSYTRSVLAGMLIVAAVTVLFSFVSFTLAHMILGVIFASIYGAWILTDIAIIGYILTATFGFIFLIDRGIKIADVRRIRNKLNPKEVKPDGFVKHAYKSWKNRFCVKVTFEDKHDDNLRAGQ